MSKQLYQKPFSEAELKDHRDYWIKVGLSTEPVNKPKVEQGLALAYAEAGLKAPSEIIYCDSPAQGCLTAGKLVRQASKSVRGQVWSRVWDRVWNQVMDRNRELLCSQAYDQIAVRVRDKVWIQLANQAGTQLINQAGTQIAAQVANSIYYSQHEADTLSQLMLYKELPEVKRLAGLVQIAENAGWVFLFENLAVVTSRPSELLWRKNQCVHIEYPDGWSVSKLSALERLADVG